MSRSYWNRNLALALISSALFFISLAALIAAVSWNYDNLHQTYSQYQSAASEDRRQAADKAAAECEGMDSLAASDCIAKRVETYHRHQATNQDLQAQQDMAFWAKWMFYATVGTVLLTAIGIGLIYANLREARKVTTAAIEGTEAAQQTVVEARKTTREAKRQADLQEANFKSLERPYVLPGDITRIKKHASRHTASYNYVALTIGNYGRTPAIIRSFVTSFAPVPSGHANDPETGAKVIPETFDLGKMLAGGNEIDPPHRAVFPAAVKFTDNNHPVFDGESNVFLVLRIKYEDMSGIIRNGRYTWLYSGMYRRFLRYGGKEHNYEKEIDK